MPRFIRALLLGLAVALLVCGVSFVSFGQKAIAATGINRSLTYQGKLLTAAGAAVTDGTYQMKFSLYDGSGGGATRVWTAAGTTLTPTDFSVTVTNGLFTVQLGDVGAGHNALDIDWNTDTLYLGVTVGADAEMTPRKRLAAVPYAFNAEAVQGQSASSSVAAAGGTGFHISQNSADAAVGDRTSLWVTTSGTSNEFDYLFKASNGTDVFTINRAGNVTTTGNFSAAGDVTLGRSGFPSTVIFNGNVHSSIVPSDDILYELGSASRRWLGLEAQNVTSTYATTTNLAFTSASGSTLMLGGKSVCLEDGTNCSATTTSETINVASLQLRAQMDEGVGRARQAIAISGKYAYAAGGTNGLIIYDISDPSNPKQVSQELDVNITSLKIYSLQVQGKYLYVATAKDPGLYIVDISNPYAPTVVGQGDSATDCDGLTCNVYVQGQYVYFVRSSALSSISVYDVTNPAAPQRVSTLTSGGPAYTSVAGQGKYLYIGMAVTAATGPALRIYDISTPESLVLLDTINDGSGDGGVPLTVNDITVRGRYAYAGFAAGALAGGLKIYDVSSPGGGVSNPVSTLSTSSPRTCSSRLDVQGRYAYLGGTGCAGGASGYFVIDVSSSTAPVQVYGATASSGGQVQDVKAAGRYVYYRVMNTMGTKSFFVYDIGGADISAATIGTAEMDDLFVSQNADVWNNLAVHGGMHVGSGGLLNDGGASFRATSTFFGSFAIGDVASTTAPFFMDVFSSSSALNRLYVGAQGNANVVIGSTTSSITNSLFQLSGNDLYVDGFIGSATSIYSNGSFVAGTTAFRDGVITKADGSLTLESGNTMLGPQDLYLDPAGSGTGGVLHLGVDSSDNIVISGKINSSIIPSGDTNVLLGDTTHRWLGLDTLNVTSTNATTTYLSFQTASGTTLYANMIGVGTTTPALPLDVVGSVGNTLVAGQSYSVVGSAAAGDGPESVRVVGNYMYVLNSLDGTLYTYDVTAKSAPVHVGGISIGGVPEAMDARNGLLFVLDSQADVVKIIDISNPKTPLVLSSFATNANSADIFSAGEFVYVVGNGAELRITDVSNPKSPRAVSTLALSGTAAGVYVQGRYAYVTEYQQNKLDIIDIQDPANPVLAGSVALNAPWSVTVDGRYAYVSTQDPNLDVVDVSDPASPVVVSQSVLPFSSKQVIKQGRYVLVAHAAGSSIEIFDAQNPAAIIDLGSITGANFSGANIVVSGKYLYATNFSVDTVSIVDMHGIETSSLYAHAAEAGTLNVQTNATIANDLNVGGALNAGNVMANGSLGVYSPTGTALSIGLGASSTAATGLSLYRNCGTSTIADLAQYYSDASSTRDLKARLDCSGNWSVDGTNSGGGADYAEYWYAEDNSLVPGDVVSLSTSTVGVLRGDTAHRMLTIGVISEKPAFLGNSSAERRNDQAHWKVVGMLGQIPVNADASVDPIQIGDPLMVADGGVVVRARGAGVIVGRAMEALVSGTGKVMTYVKPEWTAEGVLEAAPEGTRLRDHLKLSARAVPTAQAPTSSSYGFSFEGGAWDQDTQNVVTSNFTITNDILSATSSALTITNTAGTQLLTLSDLGDLSVRGDVHVGGKLYLGTRSGRASTSTYIFVDDSQGPDATYIATNADGWQTSTTYDYAERFHSKEKLQAGDVVAADEAGIDMVRRSVSPTDTVLGIVSTKPGFITGAYASGTYPIALAGRVPTRVSTVNGPIKAGDDLAPSADPGVAVKAIGTGPVIGVALDGYDGASIGLVSVFVQPGWKGGDVVSNGDGAGSISFEAKAPPILVSPRSGLARIFAGSHDVRVTFPSLSAYPLITVTPYGDAGGSWWITGVSDHGFTITLANTRNADVVFAWKAEPSTSEGVVSNSDGTSGPYDSLTGLPIMNVSPTSSQPEVVIPPSEPAATSSGPVALEPAASSSDAVPIGEVTSSEPVVLDPVGAE